MEGRQSSDKDSSKTHEPISVAEETEQIRKDIEKKSSQLTGFSRVYSRYKERPSKPISIRTADPDSFEKYESMKHASASSSPSSLSSILTKLPAEVSTYDDYFLHFGSRSRRYQRSYIHNLRDQEDLEFMRKQDYHASGHTCSSSDRIRIKLSAKQLIGDYFRNLDYLTGIISKVCSKSSASKRYSDLLVDLSEIECEKPSSECEKPSSEYEIYSKDYRYLNMHHDEIYFLENVCQISLVITQTVQESVSEWVITQVEYIFDILILLFNKDSGRRKWVLESVDISGCTFPTQVLLLPGILSTYHPKTVFHKRFLKKNFSFKIVCFFSKDLEHLKEDELAKLIEMLQPLIINGDIRKEHLQRLIQCIFITYQNGQMPLAFAANNESLTHALIEVGEDVNKTDKDGKTALFYAGDDEKVTHTLIEAGVNVNKIGKDGKTPLFYAGDNEKVTHALIEAGVNVNITDKHGKTALFYAGDDEKITHALIEADADVNITDKDGKTPLFYAGYNEKVTHALIEAGADVNNTDKDGKTALFYAGYNEKVTHALIEAGADVNHTDKDGKTALFYAGDDEYVAHALIGAGADVNQTNKDGKTALFYAGYNEKVTHALIEAGADVNQTDKDGKTPLFYTGYNEKITHALIEAGADVNQTDKDGKTALFYANDDEKTTHALIEAGADVNITDKDGKTPLFYVGYDKHVKYALIGAGADVNKTDKDGKTPLFYAGDDKYVIRALIWNGADVNITDKDGKTALFYANDDEKITHALIEAGVDVNKTDKDGKTALFYANDDEYVTHALIGAGADVNQTDKDGKTTLFYALYSIGATQALIEAGAEVNISDKDGKTAFLHVFDTKPSNIYLYKPSEQISKCLLENGSSLCETSKKEETAFHLIFKHFQQAIISTLGENENKLILQELMSILELFSKFRKSKVAVNKRDIHLNSPLHLWASLTMASSNDYSENVFDGYNFERLLKRILDLLLKCGVKLNDSNEKGEKPLHVCRTWTAVKLLLDGGANPSVTDSSGRTPLLAAAMNNTCHENDTCYFYPDITEIGKFWKDALDKKLYPWTADKTGESVISLALKKSYARRLATVLVEVACEQNYIQSDKAGITLLAAICKDESTYTINTIYLVKTLLMSRRSLAQGRLSNQDTVLHLICRNILELPEKSAKSSYVHWERIVQYLILCGANVETPGVDGKSCLKLADECPVLKDLLSNPVSSEEVPPLIKTWKPTSLKHKKQLAKAARGSNCQQIESIYYFNQALDSGSFGLVFVGIYTHDGKEVAVKRVEIMRINQEKVRKEIKDLKATIYCDKVIQCLLCTEDKDFLYVVLELMEGNLADLLSNEGTFDYHQKIKLCIDVITGLEYLHRNNITYRGIKPSNILYQGLPPAIKLKLAFFGLRCQMSEQSTSDFTDTYESLTKARCWMAPEVLQSQSHSQSSDVFSCGLVIHYLLSDKKHPFAPVVSSEETSLAVSIETVGNITHNKIELDETISSDAKDLLKGMFDQDTFHRPKISQVLAHRCFQATSE